ncbi:MAG: hypothetical protein R2862_04230 [Thermoanaerobaculia bacterium]
MTEHSGGRPPFTDLPRESPPPTALEQSVVDRLRARGEFARRASRPWIPAIAAALAGLAVGLLLSRPPVPAGGDLPAADPRPLFAYIFSGGPQSGDGLRQTIESNRTWARTALADRLVGARKLLGDSVLVRPDRSIETLAGPRSDDLVPTGFFLVRARDLAEAIDLAGSCPLLALGVSVTVRPVDDLRWMEEQAMNGPEVSSAVRSRTASSPTTVARSNRSPS